MFFGTPGTYIFLHCFAIALLLFVMNNECESFLSKLFFPFRDMRGKEFTLRRSYYQLQWLLSCDNVALSWRRILWSCSMRSSTYLTQGYACLIVSHIFLLVSFLIYIKIFLLNITLHRKCLIRNQTAVDLVSMRRSRRRSYSKWGKLSATWCSSMKKGKKWNFHFK